MSGDVAFHPAALRRADETDARLGEVLQALRVQKRLTRAAVAEVIGVSPQQIMKYEKGVDRLSVGRLFKIARLLEVQPSSIMLTLECEATEPDPEVGRLLGLFEQLEPPQRALLLSIAAAITASAYKPPVAEGVAA